MKQNSSPTNPKIVNKRIIIFLDLDCFEVQVRLTKFRPDLIGKDVPIIVVNRDKRILSVNYTAKNMGIEPGDWDFLRVARSHCRRNGNQLIELENRKLFGQDGTFLPQVESDKILRAIQSFPADLGRKSSSVLIERSSRDEFYIDVTGLIQDSSDKIPSRSKINQLSKPKNCNLSAKNYGKSTTIMETSESEPITGQKLFNRIHDEREKSNEDLEELSLVHGALIAHKLIDTIKKKTGYEASAGIAHSKLVAKLGCSRNKPEGITIISNSSHQRLQKQIHFQDLPGFAGVTGSQIKDYFEDKDNRRVASIKQLLRASNDGEDFEHAFKRLEITDAEIRAKELYDFCRFLDERPVIPFVYQKTFSTSLSFKGDESWEEFKDKIKDLCKDMQQKIDCNSKRGRRAETLIIKATMFKAANDKVPHYLENTKQLGQDSSENIINSLLHEYFRDNHLFHKKIWNICLTANA